MSMMEVEKAGQELLDLSSRVLFPRFPEPRHTAFNPNAEGSLVGIGSHTCKWAKLKPDLTARAYVST
jgi:hypothetical protein